MKTGQFSTRPFFIQLEMIVLLDFYQKIHGVFFTYIEPKRVFRVSLKEFVDIFSSNGLNSHPKQKIFLKALRSDINKLETIIYPCFMSFRSLVPMLWVKELDNTIKYYEEVLGFSCGERSDDWGWAAMHRDNVELMFAIPLHDPTFQNSSYTGSFYIYTELTDNLWLELKDKVEVVYAIDNFHYNMRDFAIKDINGFMLQFGRNLREGETVNSDEG